MLSPTIFISVIDVSTEITGYASLNHAENDSVDFLYRGAGDAPDKAIQIFGGWVDLNKHIVVARRLSPPSQSARALVEIFMCRTNSSRSIKKLGTRTLLIS